jgi:hypothetical protein
MTRQINKEGRLQDFHHEVGAIWRSRNQELEQEVFDRLPPWMGPEEAEEADRDRQIDLERLMPKVLEHLTKRERMVLVCLYLHDRTLEEIGRGCFDVTRERIRQIEKHAIRRLKHPSRSADLQTLLDEYPLRILKQNEQREATRKANMEFLDQWYEDKLFKKLLNLRS